MVEMRGKEYREKNIPILKDKINDLGIQLGLVVIQVGEDEASNVYVKQKEKLALELGYKFIHKKYKEDVNNDKVINYINKLNKDDSIDGIIVQMPLPKHLDTELIQNTISPLKDVDGLTYINAGKLVQNTPTLIPCTPKGIVDLLDEFKIDLDGKNVVVIGRSILVGKPIANLLTNRNATVTLVHSHTKDISYYTKNADILVVAINKCEYIKSNINEEEVFCTIGKTYLFTSISAYLPDKQLYSLTKKLFFTYNDFINEFGENKRGNIVCSYYIVPYKYNLGDKYELKYSTRENNICIKDDGAEVFKLYKRTE